MYCEAESPVNVVPGRGIIGGGGWDGATSAGLSLERGAEAAGLPDWPVAVGAADAPSVWGTRLSRLETTTPGADSVSASSD